jgi:hypothetical protein
MSQILTTRTDQFIRKLHLPVYRQRSKRFNHSREKRGVDSRDRKRFDYRTGERQVIGQVFRDGGRWSGALPAERFGRRGAWMPSRQP